MHCFLFAPFGKISSWAGLGQVGSCIGTASECDAKTKLQESFTPSQAFAPYGVAGAG